MILLDTNVVSEAMKPAPDNTVRAWLDDQAAETLYLSSVTIAELMFGIGALPDGKRKDRLTEALAGVMELFADRVHHVARPPAEPSRVAAAAMAICGLVLARAAWPAANYAGSSTFLVVAGLFAVACLTNRAPGTSTSS